MRFHVFPLRDHGLGFLRDGVWSETAIFEGTRPYVRTTRRVGNFKEQNWGVSVSAISGIIGWKNALNHFAIIYPGCLPEGI